MNALAIDAFCGAGNATIGITRAGYRTIGLEANADACATHHAAGHSTIRADLSTYPWPDSLRGRVALLHGSPPCQPFSSAGDGAGEDDPRDGMPWFLSAVAAIRPPLVTVENVPGLTFEKHRAYFGAFLHELRNLGYAVDWRILNAADFGVPQCRERLIVVARTVGHPRWPQVTHTDGGGLFLEPWVSMADALGWPAEWAVKHIRGAGMAERYGDRPAHSASGPAPTVETESRRRWHLHTNVDQREDGTRQTRDIDRPAPTISAKSGGQWYYERPSTTIACDTRVSAPGHHDPNVSGSQQADAVRVTLDELAALQAFPDGYPFVGNRTSIARQIGNALPAPLIEAVIRANMEAAA